MSDIPGREDDALLCVSDEHDCEPGGAAIAGSS
jgi:hypothetical protein